jgi:hypothetical protein
MSNTKNIKTVLPEEAPYGGLTSKNSFNLAEALQGLSLRDRAHLLGYYEVFLWVTPGAPDSVKTVFSTFPTDFVLSGSVAGGTAYFVSVKSFDELEAEGYPEFKRIVLDAGYPNRAYYAGISANDQFGASSPGSMMFSIEESSYADPLGDGNYYLAPVFYFQYFNFTEESYQVDQWPVDGAMCAFRFLLNPNPNI